MPCAKTAAGQHAARANARTLRRGNGHLPQNPGREKYNGSRRLRGPLRRGTALGEQPGEIVELVAAEIGYEPEAHVVPGEALDVEAVARQCLFRFLCLG